MDTDTKFILQTLCLGLMIYLASLLLISLCFIPGIISNELNLYYCKRDVKYCERIK